MPDEARVSAVLAAARSKLEEVHRLRFEPIAITGIACRFPGPPGLRGFDSMLQAGAHAIREIPAERIDPSVLPSPRFAGLLDLEYDRFDPRFFGLSLREARRMDPQQRMLLELAWEALESAAIAPESLRGSRTGVFLGIGQNDHALRVFREPPEKIDVYDGTGNGFAFAAGRISHVFDLQGPNLAIDTACSASLVALHQAILSLRNGESTLALVGGIQRILSPEVTVFLRKSGALAPDGRSKAFAATADGFGRGEGGAMIVLKRLSDAQKDNDRIVAIVRGTAIGHGGASGGLTIPNGDAQTDLLRSALANARLAPDEIDFVEAHGTGTPLGDPIELRALGEVFGKARGHAGPLGVGSVKANIGHLEAAAGVAGIIKVVLALEKEIFPPQPAFGAPTQRVDWEALGLELVTTHRPWPRENARDDAPRSTRRALVSAFGMAGSNACAVIEEAPRGAGIKDADRPTEGNHHVICLSAGSREALEQLVTETVRYLGSHPDLDIPGLARTTQTGRSHLPYRVSISGNTLPDIIQGLTTAPRRRAGGQRPRIAFLFTGQGSQYAGMGSDLFATEPRFRQTLEHCQDVLRTTHALETQAWDSTELTAVMDGRSAGLIDRTLWTQPALYALECALVDLLAAWGVRPDIVAGHSVGEFAAAYAAGLFELEAGLRLVAARALAMEQTHAVGRMIDVNTDQATAIAAIQDFANEVSIAAINGPRRLVLSGASAAIDTLERQLTAAGCSVRSLVVSHPFHSPLMQSACGPIVSAAKRVEHRSARIDFISGVDAARTRSLEPDYWGRQAVAPVRFAGVVDTLLGADVDAIIEIGPRPVLLSFVRACAQGRPLPPLLAAMDTPGVDDKGRTLCHMLSELHGVGVAIDWHHYRSTRPARPVELVHTPYDRQSFNLSEEERTQDVNRLLVREYVLDETQLRGTDEHRLDGNPFAPGVTYTEMVRSLIHDAFGSVEHWLEDVVYQAIFFFPPERRRAVRVSLDLEASEPVTDARSGFKAAGFRVHSRDAEGGDWTCHAQGRVRFESPVEPNPQALSRHD
nr:type I polyketide synthase [Halochromatium glycolicum]